MIAADRILPSRSYSASCIVIPNPAFAFHPIQLSPDHSEASRHSRPADRVDLFDLPLGVTQHLLSCVGDYIVCRSASFTNRVVRVDYVDVQGALVSKVLADSELSTFLAGRYPLECVHRYQGSIANAEIAVAGDLLTDTRQLRSCSVGERQRALTLVLQARRLSTTQSLARQDAGLFVELVALALKRRVNAEIEWVLQSTLSSLEVADSKLFYDVVAAVVRHASFSDFLLFTRLLNDQQYTPSDPMAVIKCALRNSDRNVCGAWFSEGSVLTPDLRAYAIEKASTEVLEMLIERGHLSEREYISNHDEYPDNERLFRAHVAKTKVPNRADVYMGLAPSPESVDYVSRLYGAPTLDLALRTAIISRRPAVAIRVMDAGGHTIQQLTKIVTDAFPNSCEQELAHYTRVLMQQRRNKEARLVIKSIRPVYTRAGWSDERVKSHVLLKLFCESAYHPAPGNSEKLDSLLFPKPIRRTPQEQTPTALETFTEQELLGFYDRVLKLNPMPFLPSFLRFSGSQGYYFKLIEGAIRHNRPDVIEQIVQQRKGPQIVNLDLGHLAKRHHNLSGYCYLLGDSQVALSGVALELSLVPESKLIQEAVDYFLNSEFDDCWELLYRTLKISDEEQPVRTAEKILITRGPLMIPYRSNSARAQAIANSNHPNTTHYATWQRLCANERYRNVAHALGVMQEHRQVGFLELIHELRNSMQQFRRLRTEVRDIHLAGELQFVESIVRSIIDKPALTITHEGIRLTTLTTKADGVHLALCEPVVFPKIIQELQLLLDRIRETRDAKLIPRMYWLFVHAGLQYDPEGILALQLHQVLSLYCGCRPRAVSREYVFPHFVALVSDMQRFVDVSYPHLFVEMDPLS